MDDNERGQAGFEVYFGEWSSREAMIQGFSGYDSAPSEKVEADLAGHEILFAHYDCPGYEGSAHVVTTKGGKLYEVYSSHCSCNGLQWEEPEETSLAALRKRTYWEAEYLKTKLQGALDRWEARS